MEFFKKNFIGWFSLKPKIHTLDYTPPFVSEGQVWWFHCGENIGTEMCGKNEKFSRPCIIYKKLSRYTFLVIPLTTKIRTGSWYVPLNTGALQKKSVACLHQVKIIDYRRLYEKKGELSFKEFSQLQINFLDLYG